MHYLDKLFNPTSIAVIGASDRANSVGYKVFYNLIKGNFQGNLYPVNPNHGLIQGHTAYASVKDIIHPVDLVVITTPASEVPHLIAECGEKGVRAAIIISAGFSETGREGQELEQSFIKLAQQYHIRLMGPNCLGLLRPHLSINATFDNSTPIPGQIALVSQSGAICAAILDWAVDKKIGFSAVVSLGNAADLDFGEMLDFLALDSETKSILLYIEGIHNARRFMSGLRAAARMKPVIVVKGGRMSQGSRAAHSHTGALVGDDDAFDAAIKRAGAVRVMTIEQLFSAAEILSSNYRTAGRRLAIITNGGGAGVMAADRATEVDVSLPKLDEQSVTELNKVLPSTWSHQNPIDLIGDATPERYHAALEICLRDANVDGILVLLVPVAMSDPLKVAEQVAAVAKTSKKPVLVCWMGEKQVRSSWEYFAKNGIPYFHTPEDAVEAFSYLAEYQRNQQLLLQVPPPFSPQPKPDTKGARLIIESALSEGRNILTTIESKAIMRAFGIPITPTIAAGSANEALVVAESLQFPVVMKINSPDITHKQDVGGVQLDIESADVVRLVYNQIMDSAKAARPDAKLLGVTIEKMHKNINNRELVVGVVRDKVFGPVITFGAGGSLVEIWHDRSIALPPLNQLIIKNLIDRTRIAKTLTNFRNMKPANVNALSDIISRVSEMVCELPHIQEMDINPLIVNDEEAIAVDARFVVSSPLVSFVPYYHMAICPYPSHLISTWQLTDGRNITIRPIRPEDAKIEKDFVHNLSDESKYFRFMEHLQELTQEMLVRFTQIDYDREMALISTYQKNGEEIHIGVARYIINPDQESCEFALVVADDWQNKGIGTRLMTVLIEIARSHGLKSMTGEVLNKNKPMLSLVERLGFVKLYSDDPTISVVSKSLI